ncbi:DUF4412 domain-containing protein [Parapedobacter sp. 2B3]|uniref:DUF4412 domain-containing protein n=1 Tax=Parapedobacter sp. 2B3 TaxID=3342381 RepID=UPI0035B62E39
MNYRTTLLILAVTTGSIGVANGQFLEKLAKKAEKAAERTVERRVEREAEKKTDKALDKVFEEGAKEDTKKDKGVGSSALATMLGGGNMEDVPDTYTFSYRATMNVVDDTETEEANVLYWLEPDATYFGTEVQAGEASGQVAVMDMAIKSMVMFMDDGKQKTVIRLDGNQQILDQYMKEAAEEATEEVAVTPIESKTILGYRCKGFQVETDDGISKVWMTDEAPVGMIGGMMKSEYLPKGLPDLGPNALFMEMEYVPKTGKKGNVRMVCTELKPVSMAIHKKEYQGLYPPRDTN